MARRPPSRRGLLITAGLVLAFVVWTALVVATPGPATLDRWLLARPVAPLSGLGQVLSALALVTYPYLLYAVLLAIAAWAVRRRLRSVAAALVLASALAAVSAFVLRRVIRRDRPEQVMESITATSFAFPSGHVTAAMTVAVMVAAVLTVTRASKDARRWWSIGATGGVIVVAIDRWAMSAHWVSDIVGGLLLGAACSAVALVAADVHVLPRAWRDLVWSPTAAVETAPSAPRCAIVFNPTKITDWVTFRRHVEYELTRRGYSRPLWLETTADDSGREMTARAVAEEVDLVLGAGGDGTIRVIASGLAGTGIPFGLIPAGTGNLLAKNLGVPLDESAALIAALDGVDTPTDLVEVRIDDGPPDHFAVMAGIGIDAAILGDTDAQLKKAVGSAAYFVSAAHHVNHAPMEAVITVDDRVAMKRTALVMVVGNVGYLQGGIALIPDARADDGLLDLLIATPRSWRDRLSLIARVVTRRERPSEAQLDRLTARTVTVELERAEQYELDGDAEGWCRRIEFTVLPGALTLRMARGG